MYSSIDHHGRYAYHNQPAIAHWNLACLAQALLPLIGDDVEQASKQVQELLDSFPDRFQQAYRVEMARKLGLSDWRQQDDTLASDFLGLLAEEKADFTLAFRRLFDLAAGDRVGGVVALFEFSSAFSNWLERWQGRCQDDELDQASRAAMMHKANPVFIPRNHLVAEVIEKAVSNEDLTAFHRLVDVLTGPQEYGSDLARFAMPPRPEQVVSRTFCGT